MRLCSRHSTHGVHGGGLGAAACCVRGGYPDLSGFTAKIMIAADTVCNHAGRQAKVCKLSALLWSSRPRKVQATTPTHKSKGSHKEPCRDHVHLVSGRSILQRRRPFAHQWGIHLVCAAPRLWPDLVLVRAGAYPRACGRCSDSVPDSCQYLCTTRPAA